MASKDFLSDRLRSKSIIANGSGIYPSLSIYASGSLGVDNIGNFDATLFNNVGSDVFLFVEGTPNTQGTSTKGLTLFGGDILVSGSIYSKLNLDVSGSITSHQGLDSKTDVIASGSVYTDSFKKIDGSDWNFLESVNNSQIISAISGEDLSINSLKNNVFTSDDNITFTLDNDSDTDGIDEYNSFFKVNGKDNSGNLFSIFEVQENGNFSLGVIDANFSFPHLNTSNSKDLFVNSPGNIEIKIDSDNTTDGVDDSSYFVIKNNESDLFKILDTGEITEISSITASSFIGDLTGNVNGINITTFKSTNDANISSLQSADTTLQSNIDTEATARQAADTTLQSNIDTESAARQAADSSFQTGIDNLQADVDQNESDADIAIALVQTNLDTESAARQTGDSSLQSSIDALQADVNQNESDADAAIVLVQNNINAESVNRQVADNALQASIDSLQADVDQNESDADTAITLVQSNIDTEATARQAADTNLQTSINNLQADVDQNESDADAAIALVQSNLDTETSNRQAADTNLQTAIDSLQADVDQNESDADTAIALVQTNLDTEISARQSEGSSLQTSIDSLQADVDQNESDADTAIALVQTNLDSETAARQTADTNLQSNIDTESTARIAAVNDLNDLFVNIRLSSGLTSNGLFKLEQDTDSYGYKQSSNDAIYYIQPNNVPMKFVQALAKLDETINANQIAIDGLDATTDGSALDLSKTKTRLGLDANNDIADTYSSTEFILDVDSHNSAIGKLDNAISSKVSDFFDLTGIDETDKADGKILQYVNDGVNPEKFVYVDASSGPQGDAATITIGNVTTGDAGTNVIVSNGGTVNNAILNFTIPRGASGSNGQDGQDGQDGSAATIAIGNITTGDAGTNVVVSNSGTANAAIFDIAIPKGDSGQDGQDGSAATIAVGTVTTGDAGTNVSVSNSGTANAAIFDITIPKGDAGSNGQDGQDGQDGVDAPTISGVSISGSTITTSLNGADDIVSNNSFSVSIGDLDNVNINLNTISNGKILKWDDNTNKFVAADDVSGAGGGVDLTVTDNTTSVLQSATLDVQQLATVSDSGGNEATLVGIIGNAEDADYSDGLFTDFTSTTRIGTAVDRFNEVLKALAPTPAPSLDQFDVDTGNGATAKLSFGSSNDQSGENPAYLSVDNSAGYGSIDYNVEYAPNTSIAGSYRLGIYNGTTIIHGTLNEDITNDTYSNSIVNYPDNAFGSGDQGSLKLFLNGNEIHSIGLSSFTDNTCDYHNNNTVTMDDTSSLKVNMQVTGTDIPDNTTISSITNATTFTMSNSATSAAAVTNKTLTFILGSDDYLNANGSGFKQLSAAISGKFSSDTNFDNFKYRTGSWRVGTADQVNGRNYAQVKHVIGASETVTGFAEWVNDSNNDQISISGKSLTLNKSGSKYLSGIEYHTDISATYSANIDNFYKYIYSDDAMTFDESPVGLASFNDFPIPEIDTDHTKQINLSSTTDLIPTNNRIINGTLQAGFNLSHPFKNNITSAVTNETVNGILLDSQTATSTDISSDFDDEDHRLIDTTTYSKANIDNDTYDWDTTESLTGNDNGHNTGLLVFNSRLYSPKSTDLPNNGDFTNINNNPDYSGIANTNRVWIRKFKNTTVNTVNELLFSMSGNNSTLDETVNDSNSSNIKVEFKLPQKDGQGETNWMSVVSDFDLGDYTNDAGTKCGDETNGVMTLGTINNKFATFGFDEISTGDYVLTKITAPGNWQGYVDSMSISFTNVLGAVGDSENLEEIEFSTNTTGVQGNLSFGASNTVAGFTNYTTDVNTSFDVSGIKHGIHVGSEDVSGDLNHHIPQDGFNYEAKSFGSNQGNVGELILEVNGGNGSGGHSHTIDLSTIPFLEGTQLSDGLGFTNLTLPKPGRDLNNRPDYNKIFRKAKFVIPSSKQRNGYNFAKVIHKINNSTQHDSEFIEWINDNNTDAPDFTDNGSITYSIDNTSISSTEKNHLSGIEYYKKVTNIPYEIEVRNLYKNIYSDANDAVKVFDSTNSKFKVKTLNQTGVNGNLDADNFTGSGNESYISRPLTNINLANATGAQNEIFKINSIISANYIKSLPELSSGTPYTNMNDITIDATVKHPLTASNGKITTAVNENDVSERATSNKLLQYTVSDVVQSITEENFSNETRRILSTWSAANDNQAAASGSTWDSSSVLTDGLMVYDENLVYPKVDFRGTNEGGLIIAPNGNPNYTGSTGTKNFYRIFQNTTQDAKTGFDLQIQGNGSVIVDPDTNFSATNIKISVKIPETGDSQSTGYLNIAKAFETGQYNDGDGSLNGNLASSITSGQTSTNTITFGQKFLQPNEYFVLKLEANENWTGYLSNITVDWS